MLQFNPFDGKLIAAACENGNVQVKVSTGKYYAFPH